jgi:hypothetical protein
MYGIAYHDLFNKYKNNNNNNNKNKKEKVYTQVKGFVLISGICLVLAC